MTDEVKLLPCPTPWCDGKGGEPYVFERRRDILGVYCPTCSVSTPYFPTQEQAIECWQSRPTIVTDEVVERPDVVKALWAIFMRIDTMPKSNKNMGLDVWTIKTLRLVRETIDLAAMPAIVGGE